MCISKALYVAINNNYSICTVKYKKHIFRTLVADTFLKQAVGLMYRPHLKRNEAMLFTFRRGGIYPIWMLNMRFPIDIIWLGDNFQAIDIAHSVKPCSSILRCKTYSNKRNARYVLELCAGISNRFGIRVGSSLKVNNPEGRQNER